MPYFITVRFSVITSACYYGDSCISVGPICCTNWARILTLCYSNTYPCILIFDWN